MSKLLCNALKMPQMSTWLCAWLKTTFIGGFQSPTHWEPFVVGIMLRRSEPTKERVEPTTLSIIAIEITHWTRFTLLMLLRIQRYMQRNTSLHGFKPITVTRIWIKRLAFVFALYFPINFWIVYGFKIRRSLHLEITQNNSMRPM